MRDESLVVNEIFFSVQGESRWTGLPCVFVRLTGCPLRCSYCDTAYAFREGRRMLLKEILAEVARYADPFRHAQLRLLGEGEASCQLPLVEVTGGEPLAQPAALPLLRMLCDEGYVVLLETSGALDIRPVDPRVRRIVDVKCPSSGEMERNRWENLEDLRPTDELKFVVGTVEDYEWARGQIVGRALHRKCPVLVSWVHPLTPEQQDPSLNPVPSGQRPLTRRELVERLLADALPVRFQLQLHKFIWPADQRGV
ncbi:MAG: radical SAM protein [Verrucomicrobiota bacterium]|nr:radical SAM protein [Limisphaera sp.]MDW8380858.1 radical SAM protein [Verrucomicrobiota bacterium]